MRLRLPLPPRDEGADPILGYCPGCGRELYPLSSAVRWEGALYCPQCAPDQPIHPTYRFLEEE
jgi:hypothetical protein